MNALLLQFLMMLFAVWVNRHQQHVIEYLQAENRALSMQLGGKRLRFSDQPGTERICLIRTLVVRRLLTGGTENAA